MRWICLFLTSAVRSRVKKDMAFHEPDLFAGASNEV